MASQIVIRQRSDTQFQREGIRIVEFQARDYREWHLKDGLNVIGFDDSQRYRDGSEGVIMAGQVIDRIEKWAGIKRELFTKHADGSSVRAAAN